MLLEEGYMYCMLHHEQFPRGSECPRCAAMPAPRPERDPSGLAPSDPGAKLDAGKMRADLLLGFSRALGAVARVLTHGAEKYSPNGWQHVESGVERYTAAMLRHLLAEGRGEERDPDSGLLHASCVCWNALARLELMLREADHG